MSHDLSAATARRPARLLRLASATAAEGRRRGDPVLLLAAARLERVVNPRPIQAPPRREATPSALLLAGDPRNGLLGFADLTAAARACAEGEAATVEAVCRNIQADPLPPPRAWSWAAPLLGRAVHEYRLATPHPADYLDLSLGWRGDGPGQVEIDDGAGGQALQQALDGAAYVGAWTEAPALTLRVTNLSARPADYSIALGWKIA